MSMTLHLTREQTSAYWNTIQEQEQELMISTDEEINNDSKFFGWLRRFIRGVDTGLKRY